jgi:tetratricopeptide (TPR) repeat protein
MRALLLDLLALSFFSVFACGQSTTVAVSKAVPVGAAPVATSSAGKPDYSGEPLVIEHLDKVYQMATDGTGWSQTTVVARVQTEAAVKQLGVLTIAYASNSQSVEIAYARVRHPDGSVVETPVNGAMEIPDPVTQAAPFYSDLKQEQLPIRGMGIGDRLEWQAKLITKKAEAPGQFWGQESFVEDGVVLSQTLELRVPQVVAVNVWSPGQKPVETMADGQRVLRWVSSQTKPTVGKEAEAEKEAKSKVVWTPEQELDATQGKLPSVAWTTFKSWEAVGAWYRGLEGDRTAPTAEIKAKVAELTAGKTSEEGKVRAVYGFVATQIRYIGVAFGVGRYQPHRAEEVLENQYGDCKDKHTLLAAMLGAMGLHADAVLIGAGVRFNEAVPSPAAFNHLITMVPVDGKDVWLDATAEVAPYRMLTYPIRDKQALLVPDTGVAQVERTPAKPPFAAEQTMHAEGSLDKEGTSNSRLTMTFRGDDEVVMRSVLRQLSAAQYDLVVQQMSQGMGYAGTSSHAEVSRPEDTSTPFTVSYDYKREKSGDWDNYRIIPQLTPVTLPRPDEKTPPVRAIELGVPRTEKSTAAMKLPEGWGVELPEAVHAKSAYATYDETYRFEKGTLYAERQVQVLQEKVPVADWKAYKKWADAVDLGNDSYVQLTGMAGKTAGGDAAGNTNTEAQKLVAEAYKEVQQRDLDDAKVKLDKAKSLNGRQAWLWTTYAVLAYSRGEMTEAMEDYQQELKFHPEQYGVYGALAQVQDQLGRRSEAEETLKRWAAVQPESTTPTVNLMNMLVGDKKAAEAEAVAEAAIVKLPDDKKKDETLLLSLGRAQIMAGKKDKGEATLLALMQSTESPLMVNDAAYELADAGLQLAAAESATRTALGKMEETSKAWTLDEKAQTLATKTASIVATWDTLGWILYREGKLGEAEDYLNASWLSDLSATGGEHLGDVLAKEGKKNAALTAYELGLAAAQKYDAMGVKKAPGEEEVKLEERAAALRKNGARSSVQDARKTLQALRTIRMGAAKGIDGTAEYRLLLSDGKVERAEAVGTKRLEGGDIRLETLALTGFWPAGSHARMVRTGMLNCHSNVCELVLEN